MSGKLAIIFFGFIPICFLLYALGFKTEQIFIAFIIAVFLLIFFLNSDDNKKEIVPNQLFDSNNGKGTPGKDTPKRKTLNSLRTVPNLSTQNLLSRDDKIVDDLQNRF